MSLIEVVVATGILSLFIVTAIGFTTFMFRNEPRVALKQELHWQGHGMLTDIREYVQLADEIVDPSQGNTGAALEFITNGSTFDIAIENGVVTVREEGAVRDELNRGFITAESFTVHNLSFDAVDSIQVAIQLDAVKGETIVSEEFTTTITRPWVDN